MKLLLSIVIATFTLAPAHAQYVVWYEVPVQCPGGCCPCGSYCPPRYSQPRDNRRPEPDGIKTPPVGSQGTPEFKPNCPALPPAPISVPPLPPQTGPQGPPGKDADTSAIKQLVEVNAKILIAIQNQKGCQCDSSRLEAKVDALAQAVANIKIQQPAPAPVASGAPVFYDIRPHKEK